MFSSSGVISVGSLSSTLSFSELSKTLGTLLVLLVTDFDFDLGLCFIRFCCSCCCFSLSASTLSTAARRLRSSYILTNETDKEI